jgi:hypothetical protein
MMPGLVTASTSSFVGKKIVYGRAKPGRDDRILSGDSSVVANSLILRRFAGCSHFGDG